MLNSIEAAAQGFVEVCMRSGIDYSLGDLAKVKQKIIKDYYDITFATNGMIVVDKSDHQQTFS